MCSLMLSTILPALPLVILSLKKSEVQETGQIEYNDIILGSTKRDPKAQVHSSGHAKYKNKSHLKNK